MLSLHDFDSVYLFNLERQEFAISVDDDTNRGLHELLGIVLCASLSI